MLRMLPRWQLKHKLNVHLYYINLFSQLLFQLTWVVEQHWPVTSYYAGGIFYLLSTL